MDDIKVYNPYNLSPEGLEKVDLALAGKLSPDVLSGAEQEEFFDRFSELMRQASPEEEAFWAAMRQRGDGVGMDEEGYLVYGVPGGGEVRGRFVGNDVRKIDPDLIRCARDLVAGVELDLDKPLSPEDE
jgi:hypothetical protein